MKANELRIGNWVMYEGEPFMVKWMTQIEGNWCAILDKVVFNVPLSDLKPITLTRKLIEEIGFKEAGDEHLYKQNGIYVWCRTEHEDAWISEIDDVNLEKRDIWHLHRFQNIFFALTKEELEVEL